jgi:hypothetical protein
MGLLKPKNLIILVAVSLVAIAISARVPQIKKIVFGT